MSVDAEELRTFCEIHLQRGQFNPPFHGTAYPSLSNGDVTCIGSISARAISSISSGGEANLRRLIAAVAEFLVAGLNASKTNSLIV